MIVTIEHYRALKTPKGKHYCCKAREFCRRYGIDFRGFVSDGIDEQVLLNTGDALALKLVDKAREIEYGRR